MTNTQNGANTCLRHQISCFARSNPNANPVSPSTLTDLETLLQRLSEISESVSAVVSDDGVLSIAAVIGPNQRLYIELQRNSTLEAAISRSRTHAQDLDATTIPALMVLDPLAEITGPGPNTSQQKTAPS